MYNLKDISEINKKNKQIFENFNNNHIKISLTLTPYFQDMDAENKEHLGICALTWYKNPYEVKKICYISEMLQDIIDGRYYVDNLDFYKDVLKIFVKNLKEPDNYTPSNFADTTLSKDLQYFYLEKSGFIDDDSIRRNSELVKTLIAFKKASVESVKKSVDKSKVLTMSVSSALKTKTKKEKDQKETKQKSEDFKAKLAKLKIDKDVLFGYNERNKVKGAFEFKVFKNRVLDKALEYEQFFGMLALVDILNSKVVKWCYFVEMAKDIQAGLYYVNNLEDLVIDFKRLHWEEVKFYTPTYLKSSISYSHKKYYNKITMLRCSSYLTEADLFDAHKVKSEEQAIKSVEIESPKISAVTTHEAEKSEEQTVNPVEIESSKTSAATTHKVEKVKGYEKKKPYNSYGIKTLNDFSKYTSLTIRQIRKRLAELNVRKEGKFYSLTNDILEDFGKEYDKDMLSKLIWEKVKNSEYVSIMDAARVLIMDQATLRNRLKDLIIPGIKPASIKTETLKHLKEGMNVSIKADIDKKTSVTTFIEPVAEPVKSVIDIPAPIIEVSTPAVVEEKKPSVKKAVKNVIRDIKITALGNTIAFQLGGSKNNNKFTGYIDNAKFNLDFNLVLED